MSIPFKRISVGIDDSADAKLAFKHAINQAFNKDFVHGERTELEKHILEYPKEAQITDVKNILVLVVDDKPGETILKDIIHHVEPDVLIIGSEAKRGIRRHFGSSSNLHG